MSNHECTFDNGDGRSACSTNYRKNPNWNKNWTELFSRIKTKTPSERPVNIQAAPMALKHFCNLYFYKQRAPTEQNEKYCLHHPRAPASGSACPYVFANAHFSCSSFFILEPQTFWTINRPHFICWGCGLCSIVTKKMQWKGCLKNSRTDMERRICFRCW